jgi:hypothetical protein
MNVFIRKDGVDTEIFNPNMFKGDDYIMVYWISDIVSPLYFAKDNIIIDDEHITLYKFNKVSETISMADVKSGKVEIHANSITFYNDTEED